MTVSEQIEANVLAAQKRLRDRINRSAAQHIRYFKARK